MTGASPSWRASQCLSTASTQPTWSTTTGRPQCTLSFKCSPVGSYRSSRRGGSGSRPGARGGGGGPAGGGQAEGRPRMATRRDAGAGGPATAAGPGAIPCVRNRGYMSTSSQVHAPKNKIKNTPRPLIHRDQHLGRTPSILRIPGFTAHPTTSRSTWRRSRGCDVGCRSRQADRGALHSLGTERRSTAE